MPHDPFRKRNMSCPPAPVHRFPEPAYLGPPPAFPGMLDTLSSGMYRPSRPPSPDPEPPGWGEAQITVSAEEAQRLRLQRYYGGEIPPGFKVVTAVVRAENLHPQSAALHDVIGKVLVPISPVHRSQFATSPVIGNPSLAPRMPIVPSRMPFRYCDRCAATEASGCSPDHSTHQQASYMFDASLWAMRVDRNIGFGREIFISEAEAMTLPPYSHGNPIPFGFEIATAFIQQIADGPRSLESIKVLLRTK